MIIVLLVEKGSNPFREVSDFGGYFNKFAPMGDGGYNGIHDAKRSFGNIEKGA